jgi:cation transport regulator
MPYENVEALPQDVQEKLPKEAQAIYMTAFNNASENGMNEGAAQDVAWSSVKNSYEQGDDGQWHHKPEGGTGPSDKPIGNMPSA